MQSEMLRWASLDDVDRPAISEGHCSDAEA